jgi:hypothetical protein
VNSLTTRAKSPADASSRAPRSSGRRDRGNPLARHPAREPRHRWRHRSRRARTGGR